MNNINDQNGNEKIKHNLKFSGVVGWCDGAG